MLKVDKLTNFLQFQSGDEIRAKYVVTCAGLHADRVAKKSGGEEIPKIVPFRGDYLLMAPDKAKWINGKPSVFHYLALNSSSRKYLSRPKP